jgi:hypothetical protein
VLESSWHSKSTSISQHSSAGTPLVRYHLVSAKVFVTF